MRKNDGARTGMCSMSNFRCDVINSWKDGDVKLHGVIHWFSVTTVASHEIHLWVFNFDIRFTWWRENGDVFHRGKNADD